MVSPRGTGTRMHIDGSRTHAVLCMVSGKKRCFLMPPSTSGWFENVYEDCEFDMKKHQPYFRDCSQEMRQKLPMQPIEVTIEAGDVLFIPKCWMHEVFTEENSIMLTYNFLHGFRDLLGTLGQHLWFG